MGKTERMLLIVAVVGGGYWLYTRSKVQSVAPPGNQTPNNPNQPANSGGPDYLGAAGTVWDGAKKVGGALEDAWDSLFG